MVHLYNHSHIGQDVQECQKFHEKVRNLYAQILKSDLKPDIGTGKSFRVKKKYRFTANGKETYREVSFF